MNWKLSKPLQTVLLFIDLSLITIVLYEISIFWLGPGRPLSGPIRSGQQDISSASASAALELVMKKREFNYMPAGRRDPFKSLLVPEKEDIPPSGVKETEKPKPAKPVKPSVELKGILWEPDEPLAVVTTSGKQGSRVVKVGDEIDNYKVIEITENSLTLTDGQLRFILKLKEELKPR